MSSSMDKLKVGLRSLVEDSNSEIGSSFNTSGFSLDQPRILIRPNPGRVVSLWTCSKLCSISFVVGVVIGFTLKRRVRHWAGKLLKRLKDD